MKRNAQLINHAFSKKKSISEWGIFSPKNNNIKEEGCQKYELSQKTPILEKYDHRVLEENDDEDFDSFDEGHGSCSGSDLDDTEEVLAVRYSRIDKLKGFRRKSGESQSKSNTKSKSKDTNKETIYEGKKTDQARKAGKLKKYKHIYENESESEIERGRGKLLEKKYSNQLEEISDYSSKEEILSDKPAMNTLKKTFTAMLSRMPFARNSADAS